MQPCDSWPATRLEQSAADHLRKTCWVHSTRHPAARCAAALPAGKEYAINQLVLFLSVVSLECEWERRRTPQSGEPPPLLVRGALPTLLCEPAGAPHPAQDLHAPHPPLTPPLPPTTAPPRRPQVPAHHLPRRRAAVAAPPQGVSCRQPGGRPAPLHSAGPPRPPRAAALTATPVEAGNESPLPPACATTTPALPSPLPCHTCVVPAVPAALTPCQHLNLCALRRCRPRQPYHSAARLFSHCRRARHVGDCVRHCYSLDCVARIHFRRRAPVHRRPLSSTPPACL